MSAAKLGHHPPADFPAPLRWLAAVSRGLAFAEGVGIGVCLITVIALAAFTCVTHNLREHGQTWWPAVPAWAHGTIRHTVFILGFLGAAYATYTARHIRIDAITRLTSTTGRLRLRIVTTVAVLVLLGIMILAAVEFYRSLAGEDSEATMRAEIFNSSRGAMMLVLGLSLIAFHFFVQLALDMVWALRFRPPPADWIPEAHGEGAPPTTGQELMEPPPASDGSAS